MIKLIIFDLWSTVAYHKDRAGSLKNICKECYINNFRKFLKTYEMIFQVSKNVSFEDGFRKLFDELKIKYDDEKIMKFTAERRKRYESRFIFYKYLAPLLKELRKRGYKTALLSNTGHYLGKKIKKCKIGKSFDELFFSYEIGAIKPDSNSFKKVLKHFKVKPSEALMIGDNKLDDVAASRKLGMKAIHFEDGRQLRRELKRLGVL